MEVIKSKVKTKYVSIERYGFVSSKREGTMRVHLETCVR